MYGGIDLAAKVENKTGICTLTSDDEVKLETVFKDKTILKRMEDCSVVAIDAPLSMTEKPFRAAERELMDEFGPMLPLNTPGMRSLCERAVKLKEDLEKKTDTFLIETYPRAVEKILNLSREKLNMNFKNEHEYDAYLCAVTAKRYVENEYDEFGEKGDTMILPLLNE